MSEETELEEGEEMVHAKGHGETYSPFAIYFAYVGVVVHELAHYAACKIVGLKVTSHNLLTMNSRGKLGYVAHKIGGPIESWFVAIFPFILSNTLGFYLFTDAIRAYTNGNIVYALVAIWLGASISWRAHPSEPDLYLAWHHIGKVFRTKSTAYQVMLIPFLPFFFISTIIMQFCTKYFKHGFGGIIWIAFIFILAKTYLPIYG